MSAVNIKYFGFKFTSVDQFVKNIFFYSMPFGSSVLVFKGKSVETVHFFVVYHILLFLYSLADVVLLFEEQLGLPMKERAIYVIFMVAIIQMDGILFYNAAHQLWMRKDWVDFAESFAEINRWLSRLRKGRRYSGPNLVIPAYCFIMFILRVLNFRRSKTVHKNLLKFHHIFLVCLLGIQSHLTIFFMASYLHAIDALLQQVRRAMEDVTKEAPPKEVSRVLAELCRVWSRCCRLVGGFNKLFSVQAAIFLLFLIVICGYQPYKFVMVFEQAKGYVDWHTLQVPFTWFSTGILTIIFLIGYCTSISHQAESFHNALYTHILNDNSFHSQGNSALTLHLLMKRNVHITAGSVIVLDFGLMCTITGAITTYVIYLVANFG